MMKRSHGTHCNLKQSNLSGGEVTSLDSQRGPWIMPYNWKIQRIGCRHHGRLRVICNMQNWRIIVELGSVDNFEFASRGMGHRSLRSLGEAYHWSLVSIPSCCKNKMMVRIKKGRVFLKGIVAREQRDERYGGVGLRRCYR